MGDVGGRQGSRRTGAGGPCLEATAIIQMRAGKTMTQESDRGKDEEVVDSGCVEAQREGGTSNSEVKGNEERTLPWRSSG